MKKQVIFIKAFLPNARDIVYSFEQSYERRNSPDALSGNYPGISENIAGKLELGGEYYFCTLVVEDKKDTQCMLGKGKIVGNDPGYGMRFQTVYKTEDFSENSLAAKLKKIRDKEEADDIVDGSFVKIKSGDTAFELIDAELSGNEKTEKNDGVQMPSQSAETESAQTSSESVTSALAALPSPRAEIEKKLIYIKLYETKNGKDYIRLFESSDENNPGEYNFLPKDAIGDEGLGKNFYFCAVVYNDAKKEKLIKVMLGVGTADELPNGEQAGKYCRLRFNTLYKTGELKYDKDKEIKYKTAVANLIKLTALDLEKDYNKEKPFVITEDAEYAFNQIDLMLSEPMEYASVETKYKNCDSDGHLHSLAQKSSYCRRLYYEDNSSGSDNEFQKDYGRIIHCKAFRRMVDKAQVFSASKGNYYRTRMTHSQAVTQIAGEIAARLKLNIKLTEAIALGHDLGHTPFGHQGERTIKDILFNKIKIIKNGDLFNLPKESHPVFDKDWKYKEHFGGFKHNYQSVRVASMLEEDFFAFEGMNLSFQTLEGMLKHTKLKIDENDITEFFPAPDVETVLHTDKEFCSTLEGQVVFIADEIAQRGHDLDDALSSGALTLDDFIKYLPIQKLSDLRERIDPLFKESNEVKAKGRRFGDESDLSNRRVVSEIYAFLIDDVVRTSEKKITDYLNPKKNKDKDGNPIDYQKEFDNNGHMIFKRLIVFSEEIKPINSFLETIITNKVINNSEVALFDNNGAKIVENLFRAYYNDPRLLGREVLHKLQLEIRRAGFGNVIDFEFANHGIIRSEFDMITNKDLSAVTDKDLSEKEEKELRKEYMTKRQILVRNICDYISDMTDTYAINEYRRIEK